MTTKQEGGIVPSDTYNLIRQAILDKQQVIADYGGHRREMCPHAIGTKNGREQALFFQFGGGSNSGLRNPERNWRCIHIDLPTSVSTRDGDWCTAHNHSQQQSCVGVVDVEVAY